MIDFEKIGNVEVHNIFVALNYKLFGFQEREFDISIYTPYEKSAELLEELLEKITPTSLYAAFLRESEKRGLKVDSVLRTNPNKSIIENKNFQDWTLFIKGHPTFIRESSGTNFMGDKNISYANDVICWFDYPVREASILLNKKGYTTYWSSANGDDYVRRSGLVIENKKVGYILIDPTNLSDELKQQLLLTGNCDFYGIALNHEEEGCYYGIWSEITSLDMPCIELSNNLVNKVKNLPDLLENIKTR